MRSPPSAETRRAPAGRCEFSIFDLLSPPALLQLGIAETGGRSAEGEDLGALGAGLEVPHRVLGDADGVPLTQLDNVVVELQPAAAADDHVELLLRPVLVAE